MMVSLLEDYNLKRCYVQNLDKLRLSYFQLDALMQVYIPHLQFHFVIP